jgi:hypothetical protein
MFHVTVAGLVLPVLFLISHSANASSVGLSGNGLGENLVSFHLDLGTPGSTKAGATRTLASDTPAIDASSAQFGSSIENVAGETRVSSTYVNGKALGLAPAFLGGVLLSPHGALCKRPIDKRPTHKRV